MHDAISSASSEEFLTLLDFEGYATGDRNPRISACGEPLTNRHSRSPHNTLYNHLGYWQLPNPASISSESAGPNGGVQRIHLKGIEVRPVLQTLYTWVGCLMSTSTYIYYMAYLIEAEKASSKDQIARWKQENGWLARPISKQVLRFL